MESDASLSIPYIMSYNILCVLGDKIKAFKVGVAESLGAVRSLVFGASVPVAKSGVKI